MGLVRRKKVRGPYDKIVKHALELFRQELAPLQSGQQALMAQNEKITEYVRQIWNSSVQRPEEKAQG